MKRKTIILLIISIVGSFLSGYLGPWWAPAAFLVLLTALLKLSVREAIIMGGISLGVVYLGEAILMNSKDQADIIVKTGLLLGGLSPFTMILTTSLIGGITGLLSGWIGSLIGSLATKA